MPAVPYTTSYTDEDLEYLGNRLGSSPAIAQLLGLGKVARDLRQLAAKLDQDTGVTDADYVAATIDD